MDETSIVIFVRRQRSATCVRCRGSYLHPSPESGHLGTNSNEGESGRGSNGSGEPRRFRCFVPRRRDDLGSFLTGKLHHFRCFGDRTPPFPLFSAVAVENGTIYAGSRSWRRKRRCDTTVSGVSDPVSAVGERNERRGTGDTHTTVSVVFEFEGSCLKQDTHPTVSAVLAMRDGWVQSGVFSAVRGVAAVCR